HRYPDHTSTAGVRRPPHTAQAREEVPSTMSLTLYVDSARWRKHIDQLRDAFPSIVPVMKGNGYGFDNARLADEASRMGVDTIAVGTTYEAARLKDHFDGRVMVLTPYLRGEEAIP